MEMPTAGAVAAMRRRTGEIADPPRIGDFSLNITAPIGVKASVPMCIRYLIRPSGTFSPVGRRGR
jgi:hypothetical protein